MDLEIAARRLEAIGNVTRLRVFIVLAQAGPAGLAVADIQRRLGIKASSTLSHHLHRLVEAGLVMQRRSGTTLVCHAQDPALNEVLSMLADPGCITGRDVGTP